MTSMFALWTSALLAFGGPVTEVAITSAPQQTSVLISVDGTVDFRDFTMEGPNRLVVDLMGARRRSPDRGTAVARLQWPGLYGIHPSPSSVESKRSTGNSEDEISHRAAGPWHWWHRAIVRAYRRGWGIPQGRCRRVIRMGAVRQCGSSRRRKLPFSARRQFWHRVPAWFSLPVTFQRN